MQNKMNEYRPLKTSFMPALKLKQLQFEIDSWKRSLGFMMEENIHMKSRLSEILKDGFEKDLLDEAEDFQSRFLREDELISLLRNDVADLDKLLVREIFEDGMIIKMVGSRLRKLRHNVNAAEDQFGRLKSAFGSFLSENIYGPE